MFRLKLVKLNKIKLFFKKLPRILGEHALLTYLAFLFLALIFGGLIFYKYNVLAEKSEPEVLEKPIQFNEKIFQEVLNEWQAREKRFKEAGLKKYFNPFQEPTPTVENRLNGLSM